MTTTVVAYGRGDLSQLSMPVAEILRLAGQLDRCPVFGGPAADHWERENGRRLREYTEAREVIAWHDHDLRALLSDVVAQP